MARIGFPNNDDLAYFGWPAPGGATTMVLNRMRMPQDGWIEKYWIYGGIDPRSSYNYYHQMCLYIDNRLAHGDGAVLWKAGAQIREASPPGGRRIAEGSQVAWGAYRLGVIDDTIDGGIYQFHRMSNSNVNYLSFHNPPVEKSAPSNSEPSRTGTADGGAARGFVEYLPNAAPSPPALSSPASGATLTPGSVSLRGTLPHNNGDGRYDFSNRVRYQVFRDGSPTPVIDAEFAVSASASSFEVSPSLTAPGSNYSWRAMHRDSWGVWSGWSSQRAFKLSNAAPGKGNVTAPAAGSAQTSTIVTVSGTLPNPGDGGYDYSERVQLQVYEAGATIPLLDETFGTSASQQKSDSFSRSVDTLQSGKSYYTRFRHQDRAGVWSAYSDNRAFTVANVPDSPELVSPLVKLDVREGFDYRMVHRHPEGRPAQAVQVELYNASGSTKLWNSPERTLPSLVSAGATFSTGASSGPANPHPVFAWGTTYSWRARVQDTLGVWSDFSQRAQFATNSAPTAPTGLIPANNSRSGSRDWSAVVSDPDGDQITAAQIEIVRVSTGAVVSGYPKAASVSGGRARFTVPESDLAAGFQYRFRFRATDGLQPGYGPWSGYNLVNYAIAPVVTLLTPSNADRTNLVADPSAEYDPSQDEDIVGEEVISSWWAFENQNRGAGNYIYREETEDANSGVYRWVGLRSTGDAPPAVMRSPLIAVDELERHLLQLALKKLPFDPENPESAQDPTDSLMQALFYDSSGAEIGAASPESIQQLTGDPAPYWRRYGGAIWPSDEASSPRFASGTTHVRIVITPVYAEAAGRVAIDDVAFEVMPDATTGAYEGQQYADSSFFGYADPDSDGYGRSSGDWLGDQGSSESRVISVLTDPETNHVQYSYYHPSGVAMNATRVVVQRWDRGRGAWRPHHNSGYLAPAPTPTITLPDYLFRNESRYRVKAICRDTGAIDGESGWSEFVARFDGPPELQVASYRPDPERATISVSFESTGLSDAEFEGIEVARAADDEEMKIVAIIRDAGASEYTYHFPVSRKNYRIYVRQVKSVGPETIEGRWRYVDASVDYSGYSFLKHAHCPEEYVIFQHSNDAGPNQSREAVGEGYSPWGSLAPVHLFAETRLRSDTTTIPLFEGQPQSISDRLAVLKAWERERPPVCLLVQQPEPEKVFIALSGPIRLRQSRAVRYAEIEWQETSYAEPTPAELEGWVDDLALLDLMSGQ